MAAYADASLDLAITCDPPADVAALFGVDEAALARALRAVITRAGVSRPLAVSVLISDDAGLRTLNRVYRGRDEATDVLSFPLLDTPLVDAPAEQLWQPPADASPAAPPAAEPAHAGDALAPLPLGDIALSREAVIRQAARAGHRAAWECAYLLTHGALHLLGYDDHSDAGYNAMVAQQEAALALAGIPRQTP